MVVGGACVVTGRAAGRLRRRKVEESSKDLVCVGGLLDPAHITLRNLAYFTLNAKVANRLHASSVG